MKQIVEQLNKIAKAIDENVDIPNTDLITDSLDAITTALGGTPNDSNLIVDKLEDIAGVAHGGGGGGSTPFPYVTMHIVNENEDYNVCAGYTETDLNLSTALTRADGEAIQYYFPSFGAFGYNFPDETILATKNGGTADIYLPLTFTQLYVNNEWIIQYYVFIGFDSMSDVEYSNLVNMEIVRTDNDDIYYSLTDSTQNGEVTVTFKNGGR